MRERLKVVFMGTPEFAVASLGSLLMNDIDVCGVVTAPDRPAGRGRKIRKSEVKIFCELSNLTVYQPTNLKDQAFIRLIKNLSPDIIVVVAFRMIPEEIWSIPHLGTINLHASLLPQYRGAAPINHVIMNGETRTGVTTFMIDHNIDTGGILLREEVPVYSTENAGDLHFRLMREGARLITRTVKGLAEGSVKPKPQELFMTPGEQLKRAPKLFSKDCIIDWSRNSAEVHDQIRGLSPHPAAQSAFRKGNETIRVKIFESHHEYHDKVLNPGDIISDGKNFLKVCCSDGFINILSIQAAGRQRLPITDFLRGFDIKVKTMAQPAELV